MRVFARQGVVNLEIEEDVVSEIDSSALFHRLSRIETILESGNELFTFFSAALHVYRQHTFSLASAPQQILSRIMTDRSLRYQHRRLVECLIQQFDFATGSFRELSYSNLIRLAGVSKSKGRKYLADLIQCGYVKCRKDGYRHWHRIDVETAMRMAGGTNEDHSC